MGNFDFLLEKKEYTLFAAAAVEAERVFATSPAMCAVGCRKALELAVKWVYAADAGMRMPYRDNLQSLLHEPSFASEVDPITWRKLPVIVKIGNNAVHTGVRVTEGEALFSLRALFEFIDWLTCCYDRAYEVRHFSEDLIPKERRTLDEKKIREQESLLEEKESENECLRRQVAQLKAQYTAEKEKNKKTREFVPADISEFKTRKIFIDVDLKAMGWKLDGASADVLTEFPVEDMGGVKGKNGFADYVLFGRDGLPLAVVEAKKSCLDPKKGRYQAALYADALERRYGRRPMMFMTNGYVTYFWDDKKWPERQVSGIFSKADLQKLMNRRGARQDLSSIEIADRITDRYYQKEAIRAVVGSLAEGRRKHLLVMATGTGKTRTAASLVDVLSRGNTVTNVLFLADRTALVKQAKEDFKNYLPDMSLCNLCENKKDRDARIVFSTYPTILNAIDRERAEGGLPFFTPAYFDLIIIDESHRSIFKKYRAIFEYFDALLVGLTATPKSEPDRDTYAFFELEPGVPTYAYEYETAVERDHVLVPYVNVEVTTKFLDEGIRYDELSEADRETYEEDFVEDEGLPDFVPPENLNRFVFNQKTVDLVIEDLMTRGIRVAGGDRLGKTIIFAQNKRHAEFIVDRFNALYPLYHGTFAKRVVCDDDYAQTVIDDFKKPEREPHIAVSVDMLDTGIDVPEAVNLVFFKKVRSKTKFWQMLGRGTRLCPSLSCVDGLGGGEYTGKKYFLVLDYCGNFEFFRQNKNGREARVPKSLTESIFIRKARLAAALEHAEYAEEPYASWHARLTEELSGAIRGLSEELTPVRLARESVEKFKRPEAFSHLSGEALMEIADRVAPLIPPSAEEESAKRFDCFMYGLMLAVIEEMPAAESGKRSLARLAASLSEKATIPQIRAALPKLKEAQSETFLSSASVARFEEVRKDFRDLVQFLEEKKRKIIYTTLGDTVTGTKIGEPVSAPDDYGAYKEKVNRYVNEHRDMTAIYKLTHNLPLTEKEFGELERVLTVELGDRADYARAFQNTPFGLLVRKIAKLDHEAAMRAFSDFINDESLTDRQIAFVHKVIDYIEANGYMENPNDLLKAPFDKPVDFMKLFSWNERRALLSAIERVKKNALEAGA